MKKIYLSIILLLWLIVGCKSKEAATPAPTAESVHLTLGNPTQARNDTSLADNYLMLKDEYVLSYNRTKRHANWASWELSEEW